MSENGLALLAAWPGFLADHYLTFLAISALAFAGIDLIFRGSTPVATLARQWALHAALYGLSLVLMLQLPISLVAAAELSGHLGHGLLAGRAIGFWPSLLIWVLCFTLLQYSFHRAGHQFQWIWALHRIHHLDEIVDSSTTLRHHPGEALVGLLLYSALAYAVAPPVSVVLTWAAIELIVDFWTHGRSPLPNGVARWLEWVVFTPRLHRVHHSTFAPQTDSNYGNVLVIWDRLFGTFREGVPERLGLDDPTISGAASRDLDRLLLEPWRYLKDRA